jgi:hypothetical protein
MFEGEVNAPESAPEVDSQEIESSAPSAPEGGDQTPTNDIVDLDSVEKFRFGGLELTPKELRDRMLMQSDYTRKTNELAQERKYYDNLSADLEAVRRNPALRPQFEKVYPKKFHGFLGHVLPKQAPQGQQVPGPEQSKISELEEKVGRFDSYLQQQKTQTALTAIDAAFSKFQTKFELANEDSVLALAEKLVDQKKSENPDKDPEISESEWEKLFKQVHERNQKSWQSYQSKKVQKQNELNQAGSDMGPGGGTPGAPPKVPKTFREAMDLVLNDPMYR